LLLYFNDWLLFLQQLYRKKSGESMTAARMSDNVSKNRYRDISPCNPFFTLNSILNLNFIELNLIWLNFYLSDDSTRVVLNDCLTGDYINASFVDMEIPASGVINRYSPYYIISRVLIIKLKIYYVIKVN
jgi:tyrosine-protein phosphatase non-receptor type 4